MKNFTTLYQEYKKHLQKIADVKYANAVLQWDQETYMPTKGAAKRAAQMATLSELAHELSTSNHLEQLLQELLSCNDLNEVEQKNVSLSWDDFLKQKKYNSSFVRQLSEAISIAFNAWIDARKQNDFIIFEPALAKLIELKKQESDILGYQKHPYDAHINEYDKGMTVEILDRIFSALDKPLQELLQNVQEIPKVDVLFLKEFYPKDQQWEWGLALIKKIGFDFEAGRQDISEHPFTTNFSSNDVRLTTRIDEYDFANMTWSCIHELGHGLYEQGLPISEYGLPCGEYASLSIHESQSRLWENNVGRSKNFWQFFLPELKKIFPNQLKEISLEKFYKAINCIQPSLIRTEADELTYHAHVQIRYSIEKQIFSGYYNVQDIPSIWNSLYKEKLGLEVPNDNLGCLQDVHWSHGSFGYFPTYSLGSFYAAQMFATAVKQMPNLEYEISQGNTQSLLNWLRNQVHRHGRRFSSNELCEQITGEKLNIEYFIRYLSNKIENLK